MKNQTEIDAEIAALAACKMYVPKVSAFGDNNHARINAQISALKEEWTIEYAEEFYQGHHDESGMIDAVAQAIYWKEEQEDEAPHAGWNHFKPRSK